MLGSAELRTCVGDINTLERTSDFILILNNLDFRAEVVAVFNVFF